MITRVSRDLARRLMSYDTVSRAIPYPRFYAFRRIEIQAVKLALVGRIGSAGVVAWGLPAPGGAHVHGRSMPGASRVHHRPVGVLAWPVDRWPARQVTRCACRSRCASIGAPVDRPGRA